MRSLYFQSEKNAQAEYGTGWALWRSTQCQSSVAHLKSAEFVEPSKMKLYGCSKRWRKYTTELNEVFLWMPCLYARIRTTTTGMCVGTLSHYIQ